MQNVRRISGWLAAPLGVLLALTLFVAWVHSHPGSGTNDSCAICTLSHAPSIASTALTFAPPALRLEPVSVPAVATPGGVRVPTATGRAPPQV